MTRSKFLAVFGVLMVVSCPSARAQSPWPCPSNVPADARCYSDRDAKGAFVLAAVPKIWNGVLIVHAHGGPRISPLKPQTNDEDLKRFSELVREGYAWVNSSYHRPGYGVQMAVADTESARHYFLDKIAPQVGQPKLVIAHGQSWGGNVAAKLIEMDAERNPMQRAYNGALLTSAVLPGGAKGYWFRADLRAIYQYYCQNMPLPNETLYPVATGLPAGATLAPSELHARIEACTGINLPPAQRSPPQAAALANITGVIKIVPASLIGHMTWATYLFQDLVQSRVGGHLPFSNLGVTYKGSSDDQALNAGVVRFGADPAGVAALNADSAVHGTFAVPVLTMHAVNDPTAFVENESAYRAIVDGAGRGDKLVQVFVDEHVHSKFHAPDYLVALAALRAWIEKGEKPDAKGIAAACTPFAAKYGEPCTFLPDFRPQPYATRVPDRQP